MVSVAIYSRLSGIPSQIARYNGRFGRHWVQKTFASRGFGEIPLFGSTRYLLRFVDGWYQLGEFGNLPMERVLKPAIDTFDGHLSEIIAIVEREIESEARSRKLSNLIDTYSQEEYPEARCLIILTL